MESTWKPTTAGILGIIAGVIGVIFGLVLAVAGGILGAVVGAFVPFIGGAVAGAFAVPLILGIVAIVGGAYALKRRIWGLALAGSICAFFCVWFLGYQSVPGPLRAFPVLPQEMAEGM
ncbi:MAG: hypothetical protein R6U78_02975 [Bacteroidales bacterium]